MNLNNFPFRVTVQTVLESADRLEEFESRLSLLHELGFYGLELNLPELDIITPEALKALLERYDLTLTYVATGAYAKKHGLSLSTADEEKRTAAVKGALENTRYAEQMDAGIILGFFKGGPAADSDDPEHFFRQSLSELCRDKAQSVPVLAEATNRKETCVLRTLADGERLLSEINCPSLFILPDTYHMAIEETDAFDAVSGIISHVRNIHISDSNRFFPGFGDIDFASLLRKLRSIGFGGTLGIEGNLTKDFESDIRSCVDYLCSLDLG